MSRMRSNPQIPFWAVELPKLKNLDIDYNRIVRTRSPSTSFCSCPARTVRMRIEYLRLSVHNRA